MLYMTLADGTLELVKNMHKKVSQEDSEKNGRKTADSKSVLESSTSGKIVDKKQKGKMPRVSFDDSINEKNAKARNVPNDPNEGINESDKENDIAFFFK